MNSRLRDRRREFPLTERADTGDPGGPILRGLLFLALVAVAGIGFAFLRIVDLTPHVASDFFFSSNDPAVEEVHWIERNFPGGGDALFLSVAGSDIHSESYVDAVRRISNQAAKLPGITGVLSLTHGPKRPSQAFEGPLWSRLLVDEEERATLVVALMGRNAHPGLIPAAEKLADAWSQGSLTVRISGVPYVAGLIGRYLARDFRTFTTSSFVVFGLMILLVFRSFAVLLGTLVTCGAAIMLALIVNALLGGSIGVLTANLATIVFVLTQSHIIYLTSNQKRLSQAAAPGAVSGNPWPAVRETLPASFWCMLTTLLGFASLLLVEAEPLKELGRGGTAGAGLAVVCAYLFYPPFLSAAARGWARRRSAAPEASPSAEPGLLMRLLARPGVTFAIALTFSAGFLGGRIAVLDTDPPLLAYFDPDSDLYEGLEFIDRTGGTSILQVVVRDVNGGRMDTDRAYEQMWRFQRSLEDIPTVGAAASLAVLIAEGRDESFLARLMGKRRLVDFFRSDEALNVGESFVTKDRLNAMFVMRMRETERQLPRSMVIEHIRNVAERSNLEVRAVGHVFFLQGRLSELVAKSLIQGLGGLLGLFFVVALIVSRSLRVGLVMTFGIALVPLALLGGLSTLRIPVDVISSPASNVCIGMAADSMIHLISSVRRQRAAGVLGWAAWVAARREQGFAVLISTGVVCAGFSIFLFSSFPPNQRFGLAVVGGTLVAAAAALALLPLLAGRPWTERAR